MTGNNPDEVVRINPVAIKVIQYKLRRKPKPNPMPTPPYCRKFEDVAAEPLKPKRLEVSDPGKILLLTESLFNNNTHELEKKINYYVQTEAEAQVVFIVTLVSLSEEAVVQVIGQDILEKEFRTSINSQVFMDAINRKNTLVNDMSDFDLALQNILEQLIVKEEDQACEVTTIPIFSKLKRGNSPALPILVCVVNSPKSQEYITKVVNEVFRFCLPILINTSKLEEEARIKKQCQSLLHVARRLFAHLNDLSDLLTEIMSEARRLTHAERCSLFLLDPDHIHLVAKVFDGVVHDNVTTEVKIAKDQGIAGHVAATGKLLNIRDAYSHPLFYKGIDEATGFRTRNILCFPIRDECGIVGVAQLCNKFQGDFDFFDEEVALAFSIYCGLSIMHTLVYKKLQEAQNRSKLSNELMLYHMKVSDQDVKKVLLCTNRHSYLNFTSFHFPPRRIKELESPCQILRIFEDLQLFQKFRIKRDLLTRFVLYVKKGYRDTPYHNWMHAFSVTHFAYVVTTQLRLIEEGYLTHLEVLAYIISCMCHDIDHRGTTNSFQLQSGSLLANLYSSEGSVMEHHHLSQSLCILNTQDCNFLECLNNDDYIRCLALIKDMILATDLANHFVLAAKQKDIVEQGYDKANLDHKYVFICLLMTCADLSDQIKDWEVVRTVAQQIYNEFFNQGDLEKSMGKKPLAMMDREQASIPDLQIDFLYEICLPVFTTLSELFPDTVDLVNIIKRNILCWEACRPIFERLCQKSVAPLDILMGSEIDEEVQKIIALSKPDTGSEEIFSEGSGSQRSSKETEEDVKSEKGSVEEGKLKEALEPSKQAQVQQPQPIHEEQPQPIQEQQPEQAEVEKSPSSEEAAEESPENPVEDES